MRGVNVDPLKKSLTSYSLWLEDKKKIFNRRRSLPTDYIDEKLHALIALGELNSLLKNEKLSIFLIKVISERYIFNYCTLELAKPA